MNDKSRCLNCDEIVSQKYCPNCAQKTNTSRITLKHFITHDILHGVWHLERGIFFTLKEAIIRPGKAALDYVSGKRIRYYNVFYLILLFIGLNIFLNHYYDIISTTLNKFSSIEYSRNDSGNRIHAFLSDNAKILIYLFVPFFALNSFLVFKRKKLNISEHFILAGITFLGIMIFTAIRNAFFFFNFINSFEVISEITNFITPIIILLYILFSYFTAFKNDYTYIGISLRMLLFLILSIIEIMLFFILIFGYVTDWKFGSLKY